jgi:hypothetical protein
MVSTSTHIYSAVPRTVWGATVVGKVILVTLLGGQAHTPRVPSGDYSPRGPPSCFWFQPNNTRLSSLDTLDPLHGDLQPSQAGPATPSPAQGPGEKVTLDQVLELLQSLGLILFEDDKEAVAVTV